MEKVQIIPLDKIKSIGNIRIVQLDDELVEFANSLSENGLQVPIHVYPSKDGEYILKFGHRRVAAAKYLGWLSIKANILYDEQPDPIGLIIAQYIENEERRGLSYIDKARTYAMLKEQGMAQKDIARQFGISDAAVSLALAALNAPQKLQDAINTGELTPSAVEPLLSLPLDIQESLADAAIRSKTVKKVTDLVNAEKQRRSLGSKKVGAVEPSDVDPLEEAMVSDLESAVETLKIVNSTGITHPTLRRLARPRVEELVRLAATLKQHLDGKTWDDTKDLVK